MTQLQSRSIDAILEDVDELLLSLPHEDAISDEVWLSEGGVAPLKDSFFKARLEYLDRLEALPVTDELLPVLDLLILKADEEAGGEKKGLGSRIKEKAKGLKQEWLGTGGPKKYKTEGFSRLEGPASGKWTTADGKFAAWSSVGKVQSAAKGFMSGFSRQQKLDERASKPPNSKLHREDPRTYWKERGKLASTFAATMEGINSGKIKGAEADRLMGVDKHGKNVSGLDSSQVKRRDELLAKNPDDLVKKPAVRELKEIINEDGDITQEARAGEPAVDEAAELQKLNNGLSLRERAEALGTDLEMVEYHVNQINDSNSKLKRAVNPALQRIAPPVGDWPDSLGGSQAIERLNKNWSQVTAGMPKGDKGSLNRQYAASSQGRGRNPATPPAHGYADREYLKSGEKPPKGVREYTTDRGKRYYLTSESKAKRAADEEKVRAKKEQKKAEKESKKKQEEKKKKKAEKEEREREKEKKKKAKKKKVPVTPGGGESAQPEQEIEEEQAMPQPEQESDQPPLPDKKEKKESTKGKGKGKGKKKSTTKQEKKKESTSKTDKKSKKEKTKTDKKSKKEKAKPDEKPDEKEEEGSLVQEILAGIKEGWAEGRGEAKKKKAAKLEQKRKEYDDPEARVKRIDKTIEQLDKRRAKAEKKAKKQERRAKGEDFSGRVDRWLKKNPKIENLIRGSADDPDNIVWSYLSRDLLSMSTEDARDFLDRLDKGGEVFFKGYIESFKIDLAAEREASDLLHLIDTVAKEK